MTTNDFRAGEPPAPEPRKDERIRAPAAPDLGDLSRAAFIVGDAVDEDPPPPCEASLEGQAVLGASTYSVAAVVFGIIGLSALAVAAGLNTVHLVIFSILPFMLSVALFLARPARLGWHFSSDGITSIPSGQEIAYTDIEEIHAPDRKHAGPRADSFAIDVCYEQGFFTIPANLNIPSEDLYRFLVNQHIGGVRQSPVPSELASFVRVQESLFGSRHVHVFQPRSHLAKSPQARYAIAVFLALAGAGIAWTIIGRSEPVLHDWSGVGVAFALVGLLFAGILALARQTFNRPVRNWRNACFVVSPGGCALLQGQLSGELSWMEVKEVTLNKKMAFSWAGDRGPGIALVVPGARILIPDIYNRPIHHIYETIRHYWKP